MSERKPVYLLSGGRSTQGSGYSSVMRAILRDTGKESPVVAYVGVASRDNWAFYKMISSMIKKGGKCEVKRVVISPKNADLNKARDILLSSDAVFMSGGDVEAGMQVLKDKELVGFFQELFKADKLFFGASAGSIMLANEWVRWKDPDDDSNAELFPCLGIAPIICDTHAEEDDWEELKAALELKENEFRGYGIPSGSTLKVYPDGKLEALDGPVVQYLRRDGKVEKAAELLWK